VIILEALLPILIILLIGGVIGAIMLFISFLISKVHPILIFIMPGLLVGFSVAYFIELYQNTYGLEGIALVLFGSIIGVASIVSLIGSLILFFKNRKGNN
jgi:hypothetical protein